MNKPINYYVESSSVTMTIGLKAYRRLWLLSMLLTLGVGTAWCGENSLTIRNCTEHTITVRSYNAWDASMGLVYQGGYGLAVIYGRHNILAKNYGDGETGTVKCADWYWFRFFQHCRITITCARGYSCDKLVTALDKGDWLYYSHSDIQKGSTCKKFHE